MATYLVTQATGQQSQSVIAHLLAAGFKIHAVVRDPAKIPPTLKQQGITIFKGESTNFDEIFQAAQGCKGAFLNTFPIPGIEALQAKTIVAACEKAGVENLVAATTFTVENRAFWDDEVTKEVGLHDYWVSKAQVEEAVRAGNFKSYTIVRPAVLHTDFFLPGVHLNFPALAERGELDHAFNDGVPIFYTDIQDVGKYVAAAFQDPAKFAGQEANVIKDLLTAEEVGAIIAKVSGRDIPVKRRANVEVEELKASAHGMLFHLWANKKDLTPYVNVAKETQAKFGIPLTSLEAALQRDKARLLECLPA
ncbi:uncharacterized protein TrAtP1_009677 [Trichoderma atroviride]|uniref:NmrA-like domain-containing protein n=1 Tax=Hypocrea atroviridis (strain ATCC 20476 / IMI 206040) TaxID=452589 RepID=G9NKY8_HYPAI|nr:uncharacterized protein TRIATDRAFT_290195 [Trichoderma atroviride IMI 206040]EHK48558.1 hypothetical protein TRIATDRAFT_290195 [Trichoderma atroviride IMI 206040]UKZ68655.1 hypothetical protein TrAtP1_009677 [Trichoderma atroviride]